MAGEEAAASSGSWPQRMGCWPLEQADDDSSEREYWPLGMEVAGAAGSSSYCLDSRKGRPAYFMLNFMIKGQKFGHGPSAEGPDRSKIWVNKL